MLLSHQNQRSATISTSSSTTTINCSDIRDQWDSISIMALAAKVNTGFGWYVTTLLFSCRKEQLLAKESCLRSVAMGCGKAAIYFAVGIEKRLIPGSPQDAVCVLEMVQSGDPAFAGSLTILGKYYESGYGCRKSIKRSIMTDIIRCTL